MRFPGIRLVEQTEEKFRRIRDYLNFKKKTSDCNSRALLFYKRRLIIYKGNPISPIAFEEPSENQSKSNFQQNPMS